MSSISTSNDSDISTASQDAQWNARKLIAIGAVFLALAIGAIMLASALIGE